ncbi:soluble quino protein glucose/sorbosone dehydrogenase [Apodospora peruviana]|uniref:Soluble quino protein glucose/sorbosone dehydrogenase n=1 Tax=Apodospora peruviana TaxID=516989 RepID=A0AAE0I063_9PEZI|nr:soluble quino protein glucose/sorbosone dehydrogenase [Apodospora peruviana]
MKTNRAARTALAAAGLSVSTVVAQGTACSSILVPTYSPPSVASGWQAQLVVGGLTKPRSIEFDTAGGLLVVESGKGVTRHTFIDNGGTCLTADQSVLLINDTTLNHGLALSEDGKTIYASSAEAVAAWDYNPRAGTVGTSRVVVNRMSNNDLVTRTLLISKKQKGTLIVSRGSADGNELRAETLSNGLSQIRAFDMTNLTRGSDPYNFNSEGAVLGWGLRNSVGVGEHPVTGGIYAVENSMDGVTRNGKDIHENNPGEELNYFGALSGSGTQLGHNFGYPRCFAVWDLAEIPQNDGLKIGDQFATDEKFLTDEVCGSEFVAPRLTLPAHYAPLDIKFSSDGSEAYISFHGSFNKQDPAGYRVSTIAFDAQKGEPVAKADSKDALVDIMTNPDNAKCPGACFRPAGLAFDSTGRLWMTSDTTGEIYVLQKTGDGSTPTATASGTIVTPTGTAGKDNSANGGLWTWETKVIAYGAVAFVVGWLAVF